MAITWGKSANGAWKLGYEYIVSGETATKIDAILEVYIWTKYATWEGSNTFKITGDFTHSGSAIFDVKTNTAWSTKNQARIHRSSKKSFNKAYDGSKVTASVSLTGVNYPSTSYKETVTASLTVPKRKYSQPSSPTAATAVRRNDKTIDLSWKNTSPNASGAKYENVLIRGIERNGGAWSDLATIPVGTTWTWTKAKANMVYDFSVRGINRDAKSEPAFTNTVKTTPAMPVLTVSAPVITGGTEPKTQSVTLTVKSASQPKTADGYKIIFDGTELEYVAGMTLDGLLPGKEYTIGAKAYNSGDGSQHLESAVHEVKIQTDGVPSDQFSVWASEPVVTGLTPPRTSSVDVYWGSEIFVTVTSGSTSTTMTASGTTIDGLTAGKKHKIYVAATNAVGEGYRNEVEVYAPGVPSSPTIQKFVREVDGYLVEFRRNSSDKQILYDEYAIVKKGVTPTSWIRTPATKFNIDGVNLGETYIIYVRSVSEVGNSSPSMMSSEESGGGVMVFDGTWNRTFIRTSTGVAPVRIFDGTKWVLT